MAKRSGLGQKLYVVQIGSGPAYDISGDVGSVDTAESMFATIDATGIDKSAHERLVGLGDGKLAYTGFWNNAAGGQHAVVSSLRGLPVRGVWLGSATEGDGLAFAINGILTNYPVSRGNNGGLTAKPTIDGYNGDFPDWGSLVAIGTEASAGATAHTAVDMGTFGTVQTITAISVANPTHVTITGHGLVSGDSIVIAGTNSTPVIDGDRVVTVLDANNFTVPVNVTILGSAGTAQKTSSRLGCTLVALLLSIGSGTNAAVKLQHSADNGSADAYADIGITTSSLTAAAAESRVRSAGTVLVKRWVKAVTTGTFTNLNFVAMAKRIQGAE